MMMSVSVLLLRELMIMMPMMAAFWCVCVRKYSKSVCDTCDTAKVHIFCACDCVRTGGGGVCVCARGVSAVIPAAQCYARARAKSERAQRRTALSNTAAHSVYA